MDMQEVAGESITVPGAPSIPGLTFRHFRGPSDFPAISAVMGAANAADGIERVTTPEDIARYYSHMTHCDPYRDMVFVEVDGEVVGYDRRWSAQEENGPWIYGLLEGALKPEWRGRGLGQAILDYMEGRLREAAAGRAAEGERFFQAEAGDSEKAREALLLGAGYEAVRHGILMVRPLSGPGAEPITVSPMPDGLDVRPVEPERYRDVWEADVEAFRDHWGYVPPTEANYQGFLVSPLFNPKLWQVAFDIQSGQVAGMVLNFVNEPENTEFNRRRGYTEGISVRRPWRKRGLARALLTSSLQMFKDMGMTEAALGVDTQNLSGALRLYESVGFRMRQRFSIYRKPF
jgi:mycothiol synthase